MRRTKNSNEPTCDECGSSYVAAASQMSALCPEGAHHLYGYPPCPHTFAAGRCSLCGWDGSVSAFLAGRRATESG